MRRRIPLPAPSFAPFGLATASTWAGKRKETMNPLSQLKNATSPVVIGLLLACSLLTPIARAVNPPPDGAYPNFTTAEGQNALQNLTSGFGNSGLGALTLFTDSAGSFNTA